MRIMREMIYLKQKESSNDDDDVIEFEKVKPVVFGEVMDFEIVDPFTGEKFSPTNLNPSYPSRGKH